MFICLYVPQILISLHKYVSFLEHQHFVSLSYGDSMPEMQASFSLSSSSRLLENMKPKAAAALKIQMEVVDKQLAKKDFFFLVKTTSGLPLLINSTL